MLSEYPPGTAAQRYYFPQRNRIISGLSPLTVVVQAGNRSGALITAELAADQGRDVGAVPGNIDSEYNLGSNKLLREGAFALTGVQDLLEASGVSVLSEPEAERMLSDEEKQLYFLLCSHGEMSLDQLAFYLKKPVNEVGSLADRYGNEGDRFFCYGKSFYCKSLKIDYNQILEVKVRLFKGGRFMAAAKKILVIVESPSKAKTIGKFLGSRYKVIASVGHVRDLPKSKLGIDIDNDFEPQYISIRGKEILSKN